MVSKKQIVLPIFIFVTQGTWILKKVYQHYSREGDGGKAETGGVHQRADWSSGPSWEGARADEEEIKDRSSHKGSNGG